jgi:hypothetical protein
MLLSLIARGLIRALGTPECDVMTQAEESAEWTCHHKWRSNNSFNLDASTAWLSSSLLTAYIEGCLSARVNSGVRHASHHKKVEADVSKLRKANAQVEW